MKPFISLIFLLLPLFIVKPVFAVGCSGLVPAVCTTTPSCSWNGAFCVNAADLGAASSQFSAIDPTAGKFTDIASIINTLMPYLLTGAGLILLGMLIMGGFGMLTSATDAKKAEAAKSRITTAIIGFLILFAAYWIVQILEIVLGVKILSPATP